MPFGSCEKLVPLPAGLILKLAPLEIFLDHASKKVHHRIGFFDVFVLELGNSNLSLVRSHVVSLQAIFFTNLPSFVNSVSRVLQNHRSELAARHHILFAEAGLVPW